MNVSKLIIPLVLIISLVALLIFEFSGSSVETSTPDDMTVFDENSEVAIDASINNTSSISATNQLREDVNETAFVDQVSDVSSSSDLIVVEVTDELSEETIAETVIEDTIEASETEETAIAEIGGPIVAIHNFNNAKQIKNLWQEVSDCCKHNYNAKTFEKKQFYEACERTLETTQNENVSANCLWFMASAVRSMEQKLQLHEQYIKKHLNYAMQTNDCTDCSAGDMTAKVAMRLADAYRRFNRSDESVKVLERVSEARMLDVSPWLFAELTGHLALYYQEVGVNERAVSRIVKNINFLKAFKNNEKLLEETAGKPRLERLNVEYEKIMKVLQKNKEES